MRSDNSRMQLNQELYIFGGDLLKVSHQFSYTNRTTFSQVKNCIPTAIVLSIRETHDNVPGFSSTAGLPLLELGLEEDVVKIVLFPALNCTIRTDGRL